MESSIRVEQVITAIKQLQNAKRSNTPTKLGIEQVVKLCALTFFREYSNK